MPAGSHAGEAVYPGNRVGDGCGVSPAGKAVFVGKRVGDGCSFVVEDSLGVSVGEPGEGTHAAKIVTKITVKVKQAILFIIMLLTS